MTPAAHTNAASRPRRGRPFARRDLLWALLPVLCIVPVRAAVVVAYESGVEAYAEALEGIKAGLGAEPVRLVDLRAPSAEADLSRAIAARDVRVFVAVGSRALAMVQPRAANIPVVAALVLHGNETEGISHVDLDIPLAAQLAAVRALLPERTRAGIIRNPARSRFTAEALEARARKEGFTAVVVDCDGPVRLLKAVAALKAKVDFLLCFPDPDLYNPVTVKPLVLAALENRLPIVGFSPAFVRAGAAAGIYPDYREAGRQAAELSLRAPRGAERPADDAPRKTLVAVNQRIARLLGIDFRTGALQAEVFK